jgi:hypothetical protein
LAKKPLKDRAPLGQVHASADVAGEVHGRIEETGPGVAVHFLVPDLHFSPVLLGMTCAPSATAANTFWVNSSIRLSVLSLGYSNSTPKPQ